MRYLPDLLRDAPNAVSLMEHAYRTLKRDVIELRRPPGAVFTEPEVARSLGLSKTPVREALARLHRDGLVTPLPRSGYLVAAITLKDAADLCDMRILLQSEAAYRCARHRLDAARANRLTQLAVDQPGESSSPPFEERLRLNYEFEAIIANGSGNARLVQAVVRLLDDIERVARLAMHLTPTMPPNRNTQRQVLAAAIVDGEPDVARQAMLNRATAARREILDALSASSALMNTAIQLA